jgi:hypothetical protein
MALSVEEMDMEFAELVPAREVMCHPTCCGGGYTDNSFLSHDLNGNNVLSGNNVSVLSLGTFQSS